MRRTVTFVIGAPATGKTTFIKKHFDNRHAIFMDVYHYQQKAFDDAGVKDKIPFSKGFECLYKANEALLSDIISDVQIKDLVVEQTLFKAKRRIAYIDKIRESIKDVDIVFYVMSPSDELWETYIAQRKMDESLKSLKNLAEQIEFPNPSEGIDKIYEVVGSEIRLRMDAPKPDIVQEARKELLEEAERMRQEKEEREKHLRLCESMKERPFYHYCEVCGATVYCTAKEAYDSGWDYPPIPWSFGLLGPRICGNCSVKDTLFWKIHQQPLPVVFEKELTEKELKTWRRIKNEPESLLTKEE